MGERIERGVQMEKREQHMRWEKEQRKENGMRSEMSWVRRGKVVLTSWTVLLCWLERDGGKDFT